MTATSLPAPWSRRRASPALRLAALLLATLLGACGGADAGPEALRALPRPDLAALDTVDAEAVAAQRERVDALLASPEPPAAELAEALARLGQLYLAFDLREAATAALANALVLRPEDADSLFYLGHLEAEAGQTESAAARFERVLELEPGSSATRVRLAELYLDLGRDEEVTALLLEAREDAAVAARAHFLLGQIHDAAGDPRSAVANYRKALELQPAASQLQGLIAQGYRDMGRPDLAPPFQARRGDEPVFLPDERLLAVEQLRRGPSALLLRGTSMMEAGRLEEGAELFEQVVALDPENVSGFLNLGVARYRLRDNAGARAAFEQALALEPSSSKAHYNLGMVQLQELEREAAEASFRAALDGDPDNDAARFELARLLRRAGRFEEARPEYERYLQSQPTNAQARLQLILCQARLGDYAAALATAEAGHAAEPESPAFVDALVRLLSASPEAEQRDGARALELLAPFVERYPISAVFELQAMAQAEAGDFDEAVALQQQALDGLTEGAVDPLQVTAMEAALARYQDGRALREPWPEHIYDD